MSAVVWPRGGTARPIAKRFWEKVDSSGGVNACWTWMAADIGNGYGIFAETPYLRTLAHRMAWRLTWGNTIPEGMDLCHRCDNRKCVNPAHLFIGTRADNLRDCREKDRHCRGVRHPDAKLTDESVRMIRKRRLLGESQSAIAKIFGVHQSIVSEICAGKRWKHVVDII